MTNKKSYKEIENQQKRGKLRYLERLAEDEEAEQEIEDYLEEHERNDGANEIQNKLW